MKLKLVDDYGDAGFGGYWAIAICDDDGFDVGDYLGDFRDDDTHAAAVACAQPFSLNTGGYGALLFSSKRKAGAALSAVKRTLKATP